MELMGPKFIKLLYIFDQLLFKKKMPGYIFLMASFFKNIIYLFLAALGLHCLARAFSSCGEQELLC